MPKMRQKEVMEAWVSALLRHGAMGMGSCCRSEGQGNGIGSCCPATSLVLVGLPSALTHQPGEILT